MKSIAIIFSCLVCFGFQSKAQTPCTVVLKDHSVIEAYHFGLTEICTKRKKKNNSFEQHIYISGLENNSGIQLENLALIEEIKINNFTPSKSQPESYCLSITVKFKNGEVHKITDARLLCKDSGETLTISQLPVQIIHNDQDIQQIEIDIRNIDTLFF